MSVQVDEQFSKFIKLIQTQSDNLAKGIDGSEQPKWELFELDSSVSDLRAIHTHFNRDKLNKEYSSLILRTQPFEPIGSFQIIRLQADYLAALERDFINRHKSRIQTVAHEVARRNGCADNKTSPSALANLQVESVIQTLDSEKNG